MKFAMDATRLAPLIMVSALLVLAGGGLITACHSNAAQALPTTAEKKKPPEPKPASTSGLSGNLGGYYYYPQITVSNGYNTYAANNMWGCGSIQPPARGASCGVQTIYAYNPGHWWVISNQAKGNTGVLTYPDVSQLYSDANDDGYYISKFKQLTSSYTENSPSIAGDFEAAYDIWLDDGAKAGEIMIWIDNHGQTPWGSVMAHATIDGQMWAVWGVRNTDDSVSFVLDHRQTTGTVNILDMLRWLQAQGYVNANADIGEVDFGWEICSTGGKLAKFSVSRYTLTSVSSQSS